MIMVVKKSFIKKTCDKNRYYGDSSCLTYLKKEIRNSIMPKNLKILIWSMLILLY